MVLNLRRWVVFVVLYVLALGLLTVSAANRIVWGVLVAAVALAVTSVVLNRRLRGISADQPFGWVVRFLAPVLTVIAGGVLIFVAFGNRTNGWGFFGASLVFLGIGQLLTLWRSSDCGALVRGVVVLVLCAGAVAAGLAGISNGTSSWAIVLLAEGVLASPIGLSLLSEDVLERLPRGAEQGWRRVLLAVGVLLAAGGTVLLVRVGGVHLPYALSLGIVIAVLVGAIAADTPADVLIVVAVIALGWAISPRGATPGDAVLPEDNETVVVALGDSFMSGEGATKFYDGTNHRHENECRRAPTAYAPTVVQRSSAAVPDDLAFVACSGALAVNVYEVQQYPGEPVGGPSGRDQQGNETRGLDQIAHLDWLIKNRNIAVDIVIVSVGGNDALFGEIVKSCIGPGDCAEIGGRWLEHLAEVAPRVDRAYQEVRDYVGDEIPVLVVPYPVPLRPEGCPGSLFTDNEHRFLSNFVGELNRVLKRAADDAGLYYLDSMRGVLGERSLRLCDVSPGKAGVNYLALNPVDGRIEQVLNPTSWFHNSLHPNADGHRVMADTLQAWLEDRPGVGAMDEPAREQGLTRIATMEELMGNDFQHCGTPGTKLEHCSKTPNDWAVAHLADAVWRAIGPLLLVVAGVWVEWLLVIGWWRRGEGDGWLRRRVARLTSWLDDPPPPVPGAPPGTGAA